MRDSSIYPALTHGVYSKIPHTLVWGVRVRKILVIFFLSFFVTSLSYAAPCYGTKMPKEKQFFLGVQSYSVFNRYLEKEYGQMRSLQNFFLISYGVSDWFSIDLKAGGGYIKQHPIGSDEIDHPYELGGGYGFRIHLYENEKVNTVFGFQHISIHPTAVKVGTTKHKAVLDDWQFSLLISYKFSKFTPYLGARWSRMDHIHWVDTVNRKRERSDLTKSVGFIVGVDIALNKKVWFNLEGEFFDSEAFAFSLNYEF